MKKFIASLLIFLSVATFADTKISQLPLGSAASTGVNDSFPYVNATIGQTDRLTVWDLPNVPAFQTVFGTLVPNQTGQSGKCLQSNGANTLWGVCSAGSVTSVGLLDGSSTPIYSISGSPVTSTGNLTFSLMSQAKNTLLVGPTTGSNAQPTFRALVGADLPNPSSSTLGGVESYASVSSQWINSISTSGVPNSTQPAFSDISGTASLTSQVTGTLPAGNGGTGQTSVASAFVSFYESIASALGDLVYGGASGTPTRLAGNTTSTKKYLSQTGTGSVSAAPTWLQPACGDLSNAAASCSTDTTDAANISSGALALAHGGTHADLSATGGTSQVLKQVTLGGNVTVAQLACADLSNSAASCSTDTTNATNIGSGNLSLSRLPSEVTWPSSGTVQSVTPANHGVIVSGAGASATVLGAAAAGTVLTGQGASADPSFSATPTLGVAGTTKGTLALAGNTSGTFTLQPNATAGSVTWTLPNTNGSSGNFLKTDGSGNLSWTAASNAYTAPTVQKFLSTGTTTGWLFTISTSTTCAVSDTYTNNGNTYTVLGALSAQTGQVLFMSGASAPTASGTLTRSAGAGTASITFTSDVALATYTTPTSPGPLYIKVRAIGGGGGGGGGGTSGGGTGGVGSATAFGAGGLFSNGGGGGTGTAASGAGGTASLGSIGALGINFQGGQGQAATEISLSGTADLAGGQGASTPFGGGGAGGAPATAGQAPVANTGAGGGGGSSNFANTAGFSGGGGSAGGFVDAVIPSPSSTYYYTIGAAGSAGSAGTNGFAGGAGATGIIIVEEFYQ